MSIRKKVRRAGITQVVLKTVGIASVISMAVLVPNAIQALTLFGCGPKRRWRNYYVPSVVSRLAREGYITFEKSKKGTFVRLAEKGRLRLVQY